MMEKIISTKTASPLEIDEDKKKESWLALAATFTIPAVFVVGLLFLLVSFRGGIEAGVANLALLLPVGYAFAAGMVASVNPCGVLMLLNYVFFQLRTEGASASAARQALRALLIAAVSDNVEFDPWATSTSPCGPTAICLASFTAEPGVGSVTLAWETGTEVDNAGFNLYRATAEGGPYARVNGALIAAEGDPVSGASYSFLDKGLSPGTYYYKLEDVGLTGVATLHGPVLAAVLPRLRRPTYRPTLP